MDMCIHTFSKGKTMNDPPPATSVTMAKNLGLTANRKNYNELLIIKQGLMLAFVEYEYFQNY